MSNIFAFEMQSPFSYVCFTLIFQIACFNWPNPHTSRAKQIRTLQHCTGVFITHVEVHGLYAEGRPSRQSCFPCKNQ